MKKREDFEVNLDSVMKESGWIAEGEAEIQPNGTLELSILRITLDGHLIDEDRYSDKYDRIQEFVEQSVKNWDKLSRLN